MMRKLVFVLVLVLGGILFAVPDPAEHQETLIAIEQSWLADGHEPAEMENGRKCWRVEQFDFHPTSGGVHGQRVWQTWRCTVLETGTIQWEWRSPYN